MFKIIFVIFAFSSLLLCPLEVVAQSTWKNAKYEHFSQDEDLVELLMDFSSSVSVPMVVSNRVKTSIQEKVNGHFKGLTAAGFLDKLSSIYQIIWYYDSHILYIYHADEMITELLIVKPGKAALLKESLKEIGVYDGRFNWKTMNERNIVFVSGPPRYIELVREIKALIEKEEEKEKVYSVKVFPLKYASAGDRAFKHRGETIHIPGVATTLKGILGQNTVIAKDQYGSGDGSLKSLKGTGIKKRNDVKKSDDDPSQEDGDVLGRGGGPRAYIEANTQKNAIIVHDLVERMPLYVELIKKLDTPDEQVEIQVSIVEINTDRLSDIGVDWQLKDKKNGVFTFGNSANAVTAASEGFSHNFTNDINNLSAILEGNGSFLLGRIRGLAKEGDGQVLSQPSVITMDNREAIIDNSTTFFVKLEGQEEVDLVPVSVGSVLRVTPRVIYEEGAKKIQLNVAIEDGQAVEQTSVVVDNIPSVTKSTINTQAVIDENNSLLVGGFFFDQRTSSLLKTPVLGDIPLLKHLFSNEARNRKKVARLFLITPTIINVNVAYEKTKSISGRLKDQTKFDVLKFQKPDYPIFD